MGSAPLQHEQLPSLKHIVSSPFGDLSEGLETPVQLLYLVTLLGFLVVGAYLVVRQVTLLLSRGTRPLSHRKQKAAGTTQGACNREIAFRLLLAKILSFQCSS